VFKVFYRKLYENGGKRFLWNDYGASLYINGILISLWLYGIVKHIN
ncbi:hypothetical protein THOM_1117, partial [Trachipleistophora hominis]